MVTLGSMVKTLYPSDFSDGPLRVFSLDFEAGLQEFALRHRVLIDLGNWVYIWGHWPVLITTLVVLYIRNRRHYLLLRNAMLLSGAVGLVIFALWPVAPPRSMVSTPGQGLILKREWSWM